MAEKIEGGGAKGDAGGRHGGVSGVNSKRGGSTGEERVKGGKGGKLGVRSMGGGSTGDSGGGCCCSGSTSKVRTGTNACKPAANSTYGSALLPRKGKLRSVPPSPRPS